MLAWLSVWSEVQTCMWPSWCHCHSLSLASVKSRLVLPAWYWLTRVVPDKGTLNECVLAQVVLEKRPLNLCSSSSVYVCCVETLVWWQWRWSDSSAAVLAAGGRRNRRQSHGDCRRCTGLPWHGHTLSRPPRTVRFVTLRCWHDHNTPERFIAHSTNYC